uniref:Nucleolar protein 6 n=1 Tax=Callorhinchus milii TaxID=7868 RepID=A0A4W3I5E7_CALMI
CKSEPKFSPLCGIVGVWGDKAQRRASELIHWPGDWALELRGDRYLLILSNCLTDVKVVGNLELFRNSHQKHSSMITDQSWLPEGVKVPFLQVPYNVKGKFRFLPPASAKVVGSYLLGTCIKPEINVDIAITIPAETLQEKDNLNQRYFRKRALYLAHIAHHLSGNELFEWVKFGYFNSNHLKPVLLLQPRGNDEKLVTVRLHACAPVGFFKLSRFHPSKNHVRTAWFLEQPAQEGSGEPPTPHYNNSVLSDLVMEQHLHFLCSSATDFQGMKDGIAILKVWLHQRELSKGYGCFSGFLVSMLVSYLLSRRKLNKMMSCCQVLRNCLQFLDFHQAFEVVFVDPSGFVNLCADMTANKYKEVQHEAKRSLEIIDDKTMDGFEALLLTPKPLLRTFDHVFHLSSPVKLQGGCQKLKLLNELIDRGGNYVAAIMPHLLSLLSRGLGQRTHLLAHALPQMHEWPITAEPPKHKDIGHLSFGLLLNPEFSTNILEKGPQADSPEAAEFRNFWGERSELRRFQDGSICEAVLWKGDNACDRRLIPEQIIAHLLQLHADLPASSLCYVGGLLDSVIKMGKEVRSGEEENVRVVKSYDDLSRKLWNLNGLPLTITSVFPALPIKPDISFYVKDKKSNCLLPSVDKPCPAYVPALKVICHMEGSGKWPQEKDALKRIKAAFHIRLSELLHQQHHLTCQPSVTHLDVYKDGYVFRVQVAYHREPVVLKEIRTPEGLLKSQDTKESLQLELETIHLPYLTSTLHGLQQQHSAYSGTCRLAKRWISAQLLSDDIGEESIDLLSAHLFLQPAPHSPPACPQVGFLRFLNLLSTFDWKNNPLIVNLNYDLKGEEINYTEIKDGFVANRTQLPVMFIATPRDKQTSVWTKQGPSAPILLRLMELARQSLQVLERQLMDPSANHDSALVSNQSLLVSVLDCLRPPLDIYDVVIHLNFKQIPRYLEAVDRPKVSFSRGILKSTGGVKSLQMPVVEFEPVRFYLQELREAFGEMALFFYDPHGGSMIGVLFKPQAFIPQPFKTSHINAKRLEKKGNELEMVPNVEAILDDFEVLGDGLVKSIETRTENWKF